MSTGAPMPNVDVLPSIPHTHALGHSRGRHSRSTRSLHTPISHSISSPAETAAEEHVSHPGIVLDPSNGHAETSHSCGHRHSHSRASSHHDPSPIHSTSHTHNDHVNGYDKTENLGIQPEYVPKTYNEVLAGLLVALPWIAVSWYYQHYAQWSRPDIQSAISSGNLNQIPQRTFILTATTMFIYGCVQMIRLAQRGGNDSVIQVPKLDSTNGRVILTQICSIALPIYATFKVGGFLVALCLSLAVGSGIPAYIQSQPHSSSRNRPNAKKLSVVLIPIVIVLSFFGVNSSWDPEPLSGYMSLLTSVFILRPPSFNVSYSSLAPGTGLGISGSTQSTDVSEKISSTVLRSRDSVLTALSGLLLALGTILFSRDIILGGSDLFYLMTVASSFATCLAYFEPFHFYSMHKAGLAVAAGSATLLCSPPSRDNIHTVYIARGVLALMSYFAARYDDRKLRLSSHSHGHDHHGRSELSKATKLIIRYSEPYPLLYSILKENDSRRIFYFMILNFTFMLVQLSYGFATGSLGLLSDSIHMFFDCLALVVGLCAAVMSKWPPNSRFPYGYGKVDTLSGFANGIFLMIISIEIIYEAVERLSSGSQMHRLGELLAVSVAGLLVNLVGIMAFDHGHAHGHDHSGHGHSHGNENMHGIFLHILADTLGSVAVVISTILVHYSGWSGYDPIASCLIAILIFASAVPLVSSTAKSLLLALPADIEYNVRETLAGVSTLRGVIGYTVPKFWLDDTEPKSSNHGHDHSHDCSSNGHEHAHNHNHTHSHNHNHTHSHNHNHTHSHTHSHKHSHSHDQTHDHNHAHHDHSHEKHSSPVLGVIHVIASRTADLDDVRQRTVDFLREKGMDIVVQVEREGEGRCWCGGGGNKFS